MYLEESRYLQGTFKVFDLSHEIREISLEYRIHIRNSDYGDICMTIPLPRILEINLGNIIIAQHYGCCRQPYSER